MSDFYTYELEAFLSACLLDHELIEDFTDLSEFRKKASAIALNLKMEHSADLSRWLLSTKELPDEQLSAFLNVMKDAGGKLNPQGAGT